MKNCIERHKTAIDRYSLSAPMQSLYRHSYLTGKHSLLDFGCGKGDDVRILRQNNIEVTGWDPVYFPEVQKVESDIVNLGFVINVIEDQVERRKTLITAYKLAERILVVSVMIGGESISSKFEKHGDGIITSRNTFQKYYSQKEIKTYIEDVLEEDVIAIGPGIFYVFKDKIEEQNFLIKKEKNKKNWIKLSYTGTPDRLAIKEKAFYQRHKHILESFWLKCLELGRIPIKTEFSDSNNLLNIISSHQKAFRLMQNIYGEEVFASSQQLRIDDLQVYFALGLFGRRKPYAHMPDELKRDVKAFWGLYTNAVESAKDLLFSVGNTKNIAKACLEAGKNIKCGETIPGHSFIVHRDFIEELPSILRVYIGCATQLYGDISEVDLVKIHINSGKVTLLRYDDFFGKPLPLLIQRIKVKLREQEIDFFDYGEKFKPQPLYLKSQYLDESMPNYSKQLSFDKKMKSFEDLDLSGFGPDIDHFKEFLAKLNLQIKGFRFYKKNNQL